MIVSGFEEYRTLCIMFRYSRFSLIRRQNISVWLLLYDSYTLLIDCQDVFAI